MSFVRGIRGAITVEKNEASLILDATSLLLKEIIRLNNLDIDSVASIFFTCTPDLTAAFPAKAARQLGYFTTPLVCMQEIDVEGALPLCIRILIHYNTAKHAHEMKHVYLREAQSLRPDQHVR